MKLKLFEFVLLVTVASSSTASTIELFQERQAFLASVGTSLTDSYDSLGYQIVDPGNGYGGVPGLLSDLTMSSVLAETQYYTYTGNTATNYNNITAPGFGVGPDAQPPD